VLTGKYNNGIPDKSRLTLENYEWLKNAVFSDEGKANIEKVKELSKIAGELGISMANLALAWTLQNQNVSTVITGASKPEQVKENMKALDVVKLLNQEILQKIEEILQNKPIPERDWKA
jgi:aryl-alcohol dehydrogenase-like predicted oxidoreductase